MSLDAGCCGREDVRPYRETSLEPGRSEKSDSSLNTPGQPSAPCRQVLQQGPRARLGKGGVINGATHFDDCNVFPQMGFERVKKGLVRLGVVKFLAGRADHADGLPRDQECDATL